MQTFENTARSAFAGKRYPVSPAVDYTADMLQRTIRHPSPDRLDYLIVTRIARDMRNQHIASLLCRARALAEGFMRRARVKRSPSR